MLELTGTCCNGIDAVEFMESLAEIILLGSSLKISAK